jgi:3-methylfumaryl-CoA hydratase
MWAGGRLSFLSPLIVGSEINRTSTILNVAEKQGTTGKLGFVTVRHQIYCTGKLAVDEEQDIVYRDAAIPSAPAPSPTAAPKNALWMREVVPDEVLLFRYSALTFNAHRIHYDRQYATCAEGYPDLVVHGPLVATLLMGILLRHRPDAVVLGFSFKAKRPSFVGRPLHLCANPSHDSKTVELWAHDDDGWITMSDSATIA